jgi:hypothetical protein
MSEKKEVFTEVQWVSKVITLAGVLTFQPCNATASTDKNIKNYTDIFTKSWGVFQLFKNDFWSGIAKVV